MKSRPSLTAPAPPPVVCQCHRLRHTTARHHELPSPKFSLSGFCVSPFTHTPDPHLHPPHLLCTCPVHCVVLDQLHSGTFLLLIHTHVFSLTGSTSPPAPCSHYSSQCCLHHRTHEGPQSRVLMSSRPALNPSVPPTAHLCLAVSCTASVCAQYVLSMCSTTVRLLVSRRGLFPHPHRCNVTFSALPHLHVEPHFSSSFSRCGSSAPSPCGCCSSAP